MNNNDIPVWEKYTLTIEEASKYFRIGENKLRRLAEENKDAGWLIMNGNRAVVCIFSYIFITGASSRFVDVMPPS